MEQDGYRSLGPDIGSSSSTEHDPTDLPPPHHSQETEWADSTVLERDKPGHIADKSQDQHKLGRQGDSADTTPHEVVDPDDATEGDQGSNDDQTETASLHTIDPAEGDKENRSPQLGSHEGEYLGPIFKQWQMAFNKASKITKNHQKLLMLLADGKPVVPLDILQDHEAMASQGVRSMFEAVTEMNEKMNTQMRRIVARLDKSVACLDVMRGTTIEGSKMNRKRRRDSWSDAGHQEKRQA